MIRLRSITSYRELLNLHEAWKKVLASSDNNCIFLTWEWMTSWWEIYGGDNRLLVLLGIENDRQLVGIAPFMLRRRRMAGMEVRSIEYIGSGEEVTPDHLSLIVTKEHKREFTRSVVSYLRQFRDWDMVWLRDMQEDAELLHSLKVGLRDRCPHAVVPRGICPYIPLPRSWEAYLEQLSKTNRYNFRRKERAINRDFSIHFSLKDHRLSLTPVLQKLEELHKRRMLEKKRQGMSTETRFWRFHNQIAREFLSRGWLFLGALSVNDTIAACNYGFQYNNTVSFYQSGLDPDYNRYSVGMLATGYMIREAIARGFVEYDFLRGNEEYKFTWSKLFRKNIEVHIWNDSLKGRSLHALFMLKKYAKTVRNSLMGIARGAHVYR